MPEDDPILTVNGLHITFPGNPPFTAVSDLSFSISKGKTLAIVGESGSGKSLTALALMDLLPATARIQGDLKLMVGSANIQPTSYALQLVRGKDIGIVFQEPMSSLNPVMSVGDQLSEAIHTHQNRSKTECKKLAIGWLQKVQLPNPEQMYDRYPHQLSGGQKQRVMIAMAMCNHPAVLIADEPTTALDVTVQQEIIRLMQYLQQEHGTAMIFITHDLALAATIADDVLVLYKGEVMEYGPAAQVLQHPSHAYTKALLACKPSPEQKGYRLPTVQDFTESAAPMIIVNADEPKQSRISDILLEVKNLQVWFTEEKNMLGRPTSYFKAVNDVSFSLQRGEVLGLVGESGCGKSTISRCLMGLIPAHGGDIIFNSEHIARLPLRDWRRIRHQMQMIFQDPYASLNPRMTIGDMLTEPLLLHNIVPPRKTQQEVLRLLDLVQLPAGAASRYPHQFSGGQRQRIGIARALAVRPELLICDESVSALDVSIQAQILNLLTDLRKTFGLTYLFISHDLNIVHYLSDRVMVMKDGKIIETGAATQVLKDPKEAYTRKLVEAAL